MPSAPFSLLQHERCQLLDLSEAFGCHPISLRRARDTSQALAQRHSRLIVLERETEKVGAFLDTETAEVPQLDDSDSCGDRG